MPDLTAIRSRANGRPVLADLFSGAGGSARGYQRAGFYVVGVDHRPQPRYAGDEFVQADAMTFPMEGFDAIHASPPCQAYSVAAQARRNGGHEYPDLLAPTRARLELSGVPWVIENVPGAPMRADFILCGSMFGLQLIRHRWFEVSFGPVPHLVSPCSHDKDSVSIVGHGTPSWVRHARIKRGLYPNISVAMKREIMGCDWMNRAELSQAIPPAYCEWVGLRLMDALKASAA